MDGVVMTTIVTFLEALIVSVTILCADPFDRAPCPEARGTAAGALKAALTF
jgi:hypothetical protein